MFRRTRGFGSSVDPASIPSATSIRRGFREGRTTRPYTSAPAPRSLAPSPTMDYDPIGQDLSYGQPKTPTISERPLPFGEYDPTGQDFTGRQLPDFSSPEAKPMPTQLGTYGQAPDTVEESRTIPQPFGSDYPDQGSAMQAFKAHIKGMPTEADYGGGWAGKLGAAMVGGATGWQQGAGAGYEAARAVRRRPYQEALQDWQTRGGGLAQLADIETKEAQARADHALAVREQNMKELETEGQYVERLSSARLNDANSYAVGKEVIKNPDGSTNIVNKATGESVHVPFGGDYSTAKLWNATEGALKRDLGFMHDATSRDIALLNAETRLQVAASQNALRLFAYGGGGYPGSRGRGGGRPFAVGESAGVGPLNLNEVVNTEVANRLYKIAIDTQNPGNRRTYTRADGRGEITFHFKNDFMEENDDGMWVPKPVEWKEDLGAFEDREKEEFRRQAYDEFMLQAGLGPKPKNIPDLAKFLEVEGTTFSGFDDSRNWVEADSAAAYQSIVSAATEAGRFNLPTKATLRDSRAPYGVRDESGVGFGLATQIGADFNQEERDNFDIVEVGGGEDPDDIERWENRGAAWEDPDAKQEARDQDELTAALPDPTAIQDQTSGMGESYLHRWPPPNPSGTSMYRQDQSGINTSNIPGITPDTSEVNPLLPEEPPSSLDREAQIRSRTAEDYDQGLGDFSRRAQERKIQRYKNYQQGIQGDPNIPSGEAPSPIPAFQNRSGGFAAPQNIPEGVVSVEGAGMGDVPTSPIGAVESATSAEEFLKSIEDLSRPAQIQEIRRRQMLLDPGASIMKDFRAGLAVKSQSPTIDPNAFLSPTERSPVGSVPEDIGQDSAIQAPIPDAMPPGPVGGMEARGRWPVIEEMARRNREAQEDPRTQELIKFQESQVPGPSPGGLLPGPLPQVTTDTTFPAERPLPTWEQENVGQAPVRPRVTTEETFRSSPEETSPSWLSDNYARPPEEDAQNIQILQSLGIRPEQIQEAMGTPGGRESLQRLIMEYKRRTEMGF